MRNSSAPFKRALSMKDGEMNGVNGVSPLHNFVKAKQKINSTFGDIGKYLEDCNNFLSGCVIADESNEEIKNFTSEVSGLSFYTSRSLLILILTLRNYTYRFIKFLDKYF